jgi:hypothetical protein
MYRLPLSGLILASVALLMAADATWKTKPIPSWTADDARQILTDSPWAKSTLAGITRRETEDQRREGGNMGQPTGVGFDGIKDGKRAVLPTSVFTGGSGPNRARGGTQNVKLKLVWESALPVRAAELKAQDVEPPTLGGEGYSIAVYGVPFSDAKGDPKSLGNPLKDGARLKREGKPDVKPIRVEVFQRENDCVVVYLFPLTAEISKKDERVDFYAQIGRLVFAQVFVPEQMEFQGKLEL